MVVMVNIKGEDNMAEAPDISKIVGILLENPEIIQQISALAADTAKPPEAAELVEQKEQFEEQLEQSWVQGRSPKA